MSFLKGLGKGLGDATGSIMGGAIKGVGEITGSEFIKDVGEGVDKSMQHTGKLLGDVADGVVDVADGLLSKDGSKVEQGFSNLGSTVTNYGSQVVQSAGMVLEQGLNTVDYLAGGDYEQAKNSAKTLAKVGAVSLLAVGVIDVVDGLDTPALDFNNKADGYIEVENHNTHEVSPHERTLADGRVIWVDGDGDTSINRDTGWVQTNPNYRIPV